jgi:hypothetical protein
MQIIVAPSHSAAQTDHVGLLFRNLYKSNPSPFLGARGGAI